MDLVKVDVVGAQSAERGVDLLHDGFRDRPHPPGPSCIGKKTLVATTMSSRLAYLRMALPTISSEEPCP